MHQKPREKWRFNKEEKQYIQKPEEVLQLEDCKILWHFPIWTDKTLEHNQPEMQEKQKMSTYDPTCPFYTHNERKEEEKCTYYSELKYEIARIWKMRKVKLYWQ